MAIYVEVGGVQYAASITGKLNDKEWGGRQSKAVRLSMSYEEAKTLFVNDVQWYILQDVEVRHEVEDEEGNVHTEVVMEQERYDNSEYCIAGNIIDHRDGTITVMMGKPTAEELLALLSEVL